MATPTIIIGIGTSGLYTLENAQRFYYETYKTNKPKNVEFIYIETNESNRPVGTPIGNDITRVYISLDNMAEMIAELKASCNNPSWLPESRVVLAAGLGAGGIRSCGRLAMWGRNQKGDNFGNVINAITNAYAKVMHVNNNDANLAAQPTVFITGSLTGGTGAGVFIDMGYLVRHIIQNAKDIYGLFLLPQEPKVIRGFEVMYGNAYGAIKDLEHYNKVENNYKEKWPNGFTKDLEVPPYELVQFISQDYQDGAPAISTLSGLYKMAGLYLFLNIAGIYEKRRERLVDAAGNSLIGKYGTFGLSAIQFPKDQIQEFVSSQLSIELLQRLTDSGEYYLNGQKRPISRASIKQNMAVVFDGILENAFATLNTVEARDLLVSIDKDSTRINKGEIKGSPVEFIIGMFTSTKNDNYHAMVNNNIKSALNVFVDSIYQQVDNAMQSTENLYYAKYVLEDIVESIERTLAYWKSIGLSSQTQNWDNELRKLAIGCTNNTYKSVFEHDSVLKDRLNTIFELMKMHLSIRVLIDICKHVREGKIKLEGSNHELPKLQFFDDLIKKLNALIGKTDELENGNISFTRRLNDIKGDINDTTLPILRVYPSNSFSKECEKAKETYTQRSGGNVRSITEVIQQQNILNYLKQKQGNRFNEEIYLDFLKAFRLKVDTLNCIEDFNIASYIRNSTEESIRTARKATSPFLKINRVFTPSPYLPRFVVGDDNNEITDVLSAFRNQNYNDFPDTIDGKKELTDLKNIIVFYDEKGNYIPITDLSYINLMKDAFTNVPSGLADENVTSERWKNNRSAYTTN
ncbi:MAG: tubulin-like doman-containing protein [Bacteroidia bacterium]|nr:tubulin-like doman-containing protein [Bacteroidia bacterium]